MPTVSTAEVSFKAAAFTTVTVEVNRGSMDDAELQDALIDAAYNALNTRTLCNRCADKVELGDFEMDDTEPLDITP